MLLPLLALMFSSLVQCQTEVQPLCSQQPTSSMHVGVQTLRNQGGHWVTKVALERQGGRGHMDAIKDEPWSVDVDSNTTSCEGRESTLNVILTLTAPLPKPGPGYELFPGIGYYKVHNVATKWSSARQVCSDEGTHLVIINSEKENDVIKKLIARYPTITGAASNGWFWVGVERKDGEYVTIFGDKLSHTGFTRWHPGQPNKAATDNCIVVERSLGGLGDSNCDWVIGFICESEL